MKKLVAGFLTGILLIIAVIGGSVTAFGAESSLTASGETAGLTGTESTASSVTASSVSDLRSANYTIEVTLTGGKEGAELDSPATLKVRDGEARLEIKWDSQYYDYMLVEGEKYLPISEENKRSVFLIPITSLSQPISVVADNTETGESLESTYVITPLADTLQFKSEVDTTADTSQFVIGLIAIILLGVFVVLLITMAVSALRKRRKPKE